MSTCRSVSGSDVSLLLAMAHVIAREGLLTDTRLSSPTAPPKGEEFLEHIKEFTPEWAPRSARCRASDIEKAAMPVRRRRTEAPSTTRSGITEHICGVDNVQSLCNLALMTGNIGREGTGINPMRGQNNIQGAGRLRERCPTTIVGFQPVTDPANQAKFEAGLWTRKVDLEKGITKVTALDRCGDGIHAMIIDGENTLVTDPDRNHCGNNLPALDIQLNWPCYNDGPDPSAVVPWCTTRDLGPQLSCTHGFEVPHEHFQTHSAEVCEEGLSREELA